MRNDCGRVMDHGAIFIFSCNYSIKHIKSDMRNDYKLNFSIEFTYLKSHGGGSRGDR